MLSSYHSTKFLMRRWELKWKVLLCGLYLRCQVWIAGCPLWAGHCSDVWPPVIWEHFLAFFHWEITILSTSLGTVMSCLKKCFGTLGSKISPIAGESIHCISCKGNTWYSGKLLNSSSPSSLRWMNVMFLSFCSCAQTPQCTQPCYVTHPSPAQISSILWNGWSWPIGPLPWLSGNGSSMLSELLGCCEGGRVLITPPHRCMLGKGGIHKAVWDSGQCDGPSHLCVVDGAVEGAATAPYFPGCHPEPLGSHPLHHSLAGQLLVHRDPESAQAFVWEEQSLPVRGCPHAIGCRCRQCFVWGHSALQLGDWRWPLCLQILPHRDVAFLWREHGRAR